MSQYKYDFTISVVAHNPEYAFQIANDFYSTIVDLDKYRAQLEMVSEPEYVPNIDEDYEHELEQAGFREYLIDLTLVFDKEINYEEMVEIFNDAEEYYNEYISDLLADRVHFEGISEAEVA